MENRFRSTALSVVHTESKQTELFTARIRSIGKGYVFVILSTGGGGGSLPGQGGGVWPTWTGRQTPLGSRSPCEADPPRSRSPPEADPQPGRQTPLKNRTLPLPPPPTVNRRSDAYYCNAFLFIEFFTLAQYEYHTENGF